MGITETVGIVRTDVVSKSTCVSKPVMITYTIPYFFEIMNRKKTLMHRTNIQMKHEKKFPISI